MYKSLNKYLVPLLSLIIVFIFFAVFSSHINAQSVLFSENFEDGNLNQWEIIDNNNNWSIVNQSENNKMLSVVSGKSLNNEIQAGDFGWSNYELTFSIYPISGSDRNVFFRVNDARNSDKDLPVSYGLHLKTDRIVLQKWTIDNVEVPIRVFDRNIPNNQLTEIKIQVLNSSIKVFINNENTPVIDYVDEINPLLTGRIALASIVGSQKTNILFDNVIVRSLSSTSTPSSSPTNEPSATNTPTPHSTASPTPLPTPTNITLDVPLFKQTSGGWEDDVYNHINGKISQFGCALTSGAMVLKYHGIDTDPKILNNWLNSQPDGYLRNGLVNWLAISRYGTPKLEYLRLSPSNENILSELQNNRPAILKVPGHFVVTKGQTETSFAINDPGYERVTLEDYPDRLSLNSFTPSTTDLSYLFFVSDQDTTMKLASESGEIISESFIEDPIDNLNDLNQKSGESVSLLMYPKPSGKNYKLLVTGDKSGNYRLDSYLYDINGNLTKQDFNGYIFDTETDEYPIIFGSQNQTQITFGQILTDLKLGYKNKLIKNKTIYLSLKSQITRAQRYYEKDKIFIAKMFLKNCQRQLRYFGPFLINREFSQTLQKNLGTLSLSL